MHLKKFFQSSSHAFLASATLLMATAVLMSPAHASDDSRAKSIACGPGQADAASQTPSSLVQALYAIVSGPADSARDWARLRRLHAPGALITPTQHHHGLAFAAAPQSLEQFIALNERLFAGRGFFERELHQRLEIFGHIAHLWSSYETREQADGPVQARGVNSFQLLNDGEKWCVLSATWDGETASHPIPVNFLQDADSRH